MERCARRDVRGEMCDGGFPPAFRPVVRESSKTDREEIHKDFLANRQPLLAEEGECDGEPLTACLVRKLRARCSCKKSPGLDDLCYEFYCSMLHLFGHLFACDYTNWQPNGRTLSSVSLSVVTLICKNPSKGYLIRNYRSITLLYS